MPVPGLMATLVSWLSTEVAGHILGEGKRTVAEKISLYMKPGQKPVNHDLARAFVQAFTDATIHALTEYHKEDLPETERAFINPCLRILRAEWKKAEQRSNADWQPFLDDCHRYLEQASEFFAERHQPEDRGLDIHVQIVEYLRSSLATDGRESPQIPAHFLTYMTDPYRGNFYAWLHGFFLEHIKRKPRAQTAALFEFLTSISETQVDQGILLSRLKELSEGTYAHVERMLNEIHGVHEDVKQGNKTGEKTCANTEEILSILQTQMSGKDQTIQEQQETIRALRQAIEALSRQGVENPDSKARIDDALRHLAEGKTSEAISIFREIAESKTNDIKQAAESWRHLGAIAFFDNTQESLAAYRRATELDPENPEGWYFLGHLLYRSGELEAAEKSFKKLEEIGRSSKNDALIVLCYLGLGRIQRMRGDLGEAMTMFKLALVLCEDLGDKQGMAECYINIGMIYWARGSWTCNKRQLSKALVIFEDALKLSEDLGIKQGMADSHNGIGMIHWTLSRGMWRDKHQLSKALARFEDALTLFEDLGLKQGMAECYNNIGLIHWERRRLDQALARFEDALKISAELGDTNGKASAYNNIGLIQRAQGKLDEALARFEDALTLSEDVGNKQGMAAIYLNIALIHWSRVEVSDALKSWCAALNLLFRRC